jgi:hypothetical protein
VGFARRNQNQFSPPNFLVGNTLTFFLKQLSAMIHPLLYRYCYHSLSPQLKQFAFTKRWLIVAAIGIFNLQCSWTPEVETVLHNSPNGFISLQTTHALKIAPKHPSSIPESLITKILKGITKSQEGGMLQQILLSAPPAVPVFSSSQIAFLAPHLSMALSKATPEEIIHFRCTVTDEQPSLIQGTVAIFPPTNLLLTLRDAQESSGMPSKLQNSSRKLQTTTSLTFSQEEAFKQGEELQAFMAIPSTSHGIVINYQRLPPSNQNNQENQPNKHGTQITGDQKDGSPLEMDALNEQLRDLRKKVDQQTEEIQRLKQTAPP